MNRRTPLTRKTPLRRTGRLSPISQRRRDERAVYRKRVPEFLKEHPFCQVFIFQHGIAEAKLIKDGGVWEGTKVPRSTQIHHRNKGRNARLLDERWWMACCLGYHDWIEHNKDAARVLGLLLPIQADSEGRWGAGNQALETPALLASRVHP